MSNTKKGKRKMTKNVSFWKSVLSARITQKSRERASEKKAEFGWVWFLSFFTRWHKKKNKQPKKV